MLNVATATVRLGSVRYMPRTSDRALPPAQNERVRGILRELVRVEFAGAVKKTADALGVTHATVSDVLSGKRGAGQKLLAGIAAHTGRSLDDLVGHVVVYDPAATRTGSRLGLHPGWTQAEAELRRKIARRFATPQEQVISDMRGVTLTRPLPVLTGDFLLKLYDSLMQADEDAAGTQDPDTAH